MRVTLKINLHPYPKEDKKKILCPVSPISE
jgi:hypothetical protein